MKFKDRIDAAQQLAKQLITYKNNPEVLVLGLSRGGVIIAHEIAQQLGLALDVMLTRKIAAPSNPELIVGSLTAGGTIYMNKPLIESMGLTTEDFSQILDQEQKDLERSETRYRKELKSQEIKAKIVLLVDEGIGAGVSMRVAILAAKNLGAGKIIVAVPVMPFESVHALKKVVDEVVCIYQAPDFTNISQFYENFNPVTDDEVVDILR